MSEFQVSEKFCVDLFEEYLRARNGHPPLHSHHEALAVIEEEVAEYKQWVYQKPAGRDKQAMYRELVQIAAMALRTVIDRKVTGNNEEVEI